MTFLVRIEDHTSDEVVWTRQDGDDAWEAAKVAFRYFHIGAEEPSEAMEQYVEDRLEFIEPLPEVDDWNCEAREYLHRFGDEEYTIEVIEA